MKNAATFLLLALAFLASPAMAQEPEIERPGPPAVDDLEQDANKDGIPDGVTHCLQFGLAEQLDLTRRERLARAVAFELDTVVSGR